MMEKILTYLCGNCGQSAGVTISSEKPNGWVDEENAILRTIGTCQNCRKVSYLVIEAPSVAVRGKRRGIARHSMDSFLCYELEITEQYPGPIKNAPNGTPPEIAETYLGAQRCLWAKSPEGSAVMSRRAIEMAVKTEGATKGKLIQSIEELEKHGRLSKNLVDLAHGIRVLGNEGAHFSGAAYSKMTEKDAELALEFVEAFLNGLYTISSLAKLAKKQSTHRKKP